MVDEETRHRPGEGLSARVADARLRFAGVLGTAPDVPLAAFAARRAGLSATAVVAAVIIAALVLDRVFAEALPSLPRALTSVAEMVTDLAQTHMLLLAYALTLAAIAWRPAGWPQPAKDRGSRDLLRWLYAAIAVAAAGLLAVLLKFAIGRARPRHFTAEGAFGFDPFSGVASWSGFPSGHAANCGAFGIALALLYPRFRWPLLSGSLLLASTRLLTGSHYPSDVIAGYALGGAVALAVAAAWARRGWLFRPAGIVPPAPLEGEGRR